MLRLPIAELYRKYIEEAAIRNIAKATILFTVVAIAILFVTSQIAIDEASRRITQKEKAQSEPLTQVIANRMGRVINYLNRTDKMFGMRHQPVWELCDNSKAICQQTVSGLVALVGSTYLIQQTLYQAFFDQQLQPLPFFYNTTSQQLLLMGFNIPQLAALSRELGQTTIKPCLKAFNFTSDISFSYIVCANQLLACKYVQSTPVLSCLAVPNHQLGASSSTLKVTLWMNASTHIATTTEVYSSTSAYFRAFKDQLVQKKLLNNEGWADNVNDASYMDCVNRFLSHPVYQMRCRYGSTGAATLPVVGMSNILQLPALSDSLSAYSLTPVQRSFIMIFTEGCDQYYEAQIQLIEDYHAEMFSLLEWSMVALLATAVLMLANRVFVRLWLIDPITHLCQHSTPPKRITLELEGLVAMIEKYDWLSRLSVSSDQHYLLKGLQILQKEADYQTNYLSAVEFILRELLQLHERQGNQSQQLKLYQQLIQLKLTAYNKGDSLLEPKQIGEVFDIEIDKALCFWKIIATGPPVNQEMLKRGQEVIGRLDKYTESFEFDQQMLEYASLAEFKILQALGRPASYRKLEQLTKSESQEVRSVAHWLIANEFFLRKFDTESIENIWKCLTSTPTKNSFKKQCLDFLVKLAKRNLWDLEKTKELEFMARSFNREYSRLSILVDSLEGLEEKLVFELLNQIVAKLGENDVIELVSIQAEGRPSTEIKASQPNVNQLVRESVKRLSTPLEGSRQTKSVLEGLMCRFQKLALPSGEYQHYSLYVVMLMSEAILNDVRSQKESFKRPFCKNLEIGDHYMHLILIGNHVRTDQFQRAKVAKALKQAQSFLQIDLKNFDEQSTKQDLQQFFQLVK